MPEKDWKRAYEELLKQYHCCEAQNRDYKSQLDWEKTQKLDAFRQLNQVDGKIFDLAVDLADKMTQPKRRHQVKIFSRLKRLFNS